MRNTITTTWILVADAAEARILSRTGSENPSLLCEIHHPQGRARASELARDRPGTTFDRAGPGQRPKEPRSDPTDVARTGFARELADWLERARQQGDYDDLVLIAPPEFLGHIRQYLSADTSRRVRTTIDKNLTDLDPPSIQPYIDSPGH
jgi:protein required for attachment to host cells